MFHCGAHNPGTGPIHGGAVEVEIKREVGCGCYEGAALNETDQTVDIIQFGCSCAIKQYQVEGGNIACEEWPYRWAPCDRAGHRAHATGTLHYASRTPGECQPKCAN